MKSDEILAKELMFLTSCECIINNHPKDFEKNECPSEAFTGPNDDDYDRAKCWVIWSRKKAAESEGDNEKR